MARQGVHFAVTLDHAPMAAARPANGRKRLALDDSSCAAASLAAHIRMECIEGQHMSQEQDESETVFATAAELFSLLSTPIRLKIISSLCRGEKNVSQLLGDIDTTQPNMSQHLSTLYRAGVLGKRRDATQIYYRIESERAAMLCRAVCTQIAAEMDPDAELSAGERLTPRTALRR